MRWTQKTVLKTSLRNGDLYAYKYILKYFCRRWKYALFQIDKWKEKMTQIEILTFRSFLLILDFTSFLTLLGCCLVLVIQIFIKIKFCSFLSDVAIGQHVTFFPSRDSWLKIANSIIWWKNIYNIRYLI